MYPNKSNPTLNPPSELDDQYTRNLDVDGFCRSSSPRLEDRGLFQNVYDLLNHDREANPKIVCN